MAGAGSLPALVAPSQAINAHIGVVHLTFADQSGQSITLAFDQAVLQASAPALLGHHDQLMIEFQLSNQLHIEQTLHIPGFEIAAAQLLRHMLHSQPTYSNRPDKVALTSLANAAHHYGCIAAVEQWFAAWRLQQNLYNGNEHFIVLAAMSRIGGTLHASIFRELLLGSIPSEVRAWTATANQLAQQMNLRDDIGIHIGIVSSIEATCDNFSKVHAKLCEALEKTNDKLTNFQPSKAGKFAACTKSCILEEYLFGLLNKWSRKYGLHRATLISKKQLNSILGQYKKLALPKSVSRKCNKLCPGHSWSVLVKECKEHVATLLQEFEQKLDEMIANPDGHDEDVEMLDEKEIKQDADVEVIVIDD